MRHRENIFDLYNSQNENSKKPEEDRVPDEVRPEDLKDQEDSKDPEPETVTDNQQPEDPAQKKEGGEEDGV